MVVCVTRNMMYSGEGSDTFFVDTEKLTGNKQPLLDLIKLAILDDSNCAEGDEDQAQIVNELFGSDVMVDLPQQVEHKVDLYF